MATTPAPLVWDFYRETGASGVVGGVVHYYDETAQSLHNSDGLNTQLSEVSSGHWAESEWADSHQINSTIYSDMDLDHPCNGIVFGVGVSGSKLYFLRYVYAMDCTDLISSGTISHSNDSAAVQLKANIMNIHEGIFMDDATLFQPGAKITFKIVVGEEEPYSMCVVYLDSADYNIKSVTVPISGRNTVGFKLMQSTFDETTELSGQVHEVVATIMEMAGVASCAIEENADNRKHEFKPDQTFMSGLEQICEMYSDWKVVELPDGMIVVGSPSFISNYQTNGYYIFKLYERGDSGAFTFNRDLFKRKTKRSCDAAYTRVRVTGRDADGNDLQPVIVPVENYKYWNMPKNKTYHESAPDGLTQDELQSYAEDIALHLQYVGVGEDFTSSIQPHLLVGDVAAFDNGDGTMTPLGIVTDVKHSFGKSGFSTDFSTDSGGLLINILEILFTKTKSLNGYNRKQTLKDLIQVASGSGAAGPRSTGTAVIKVPSNKNAETLEGKTYQQILDAAKAASVDAAIDAANKAAVDAVDGTFTSVSVPVNILNYAFQGTSGATDHSRTYEGSVGNKLLLLIMHRGELTAAPEGWTQIGVLTESGDFDAGSVTYVQYVTMFTKTCSGSEEISYSQTESNLSQTCIIEFEGVAGFELLEETRKENVATADPDFTCSRNSTRMAIWVANALYFLNNTYNWKISDASVWAISDNHGVQPRLGVFVDNRPAPIDFTVSTGMDGRYVSIVCLQIVPSVTASDTSDTTNES